MSELLKNQSRSILKDFMNMSKNLDGNQKDIDNGTHIKIPTDVGYVNFYKSANSFEITVWMKLEIQRKSQEQERLINN